MMMTLWLCHYGGEPRVRLISISVCQFLAGPVYGEECSYSAHTVALRDYVDDDYLAPWAVIIPGSVSVLSE